MPSRFESRSLTVGCLCQWDRQRRGSEGDCGRPMVSRWGRNAEMAVGLLGRPVPRGCWAAQAGEPHALSLFAATTCRVRIAAWKARRGSPKVRLNETFPAKFQCLSTNVRGGWKPRSPRSSFDISHSHRTGIGNLGEPRQGVPRSAIDKRPAPPHGAALSFHFPILVCAIFPTFARIPSRVGRTPQPFTTATFNRREWLRSIRPTRATAFALDRTIAPPAVVDILQVGRDTARGHCQARNSP
jgi:hypothetical protein